MLTFGTDPETFAVISSGEKNLVVSPALIEKYSDLKLIPDKRSIFEGMIKHPIYLNNGVWSWMMDGVAFEATHYEIYTDYKRMFSNVRESLAELEAFISQYEFKGQSLKLYNRPVVNIDPQMYLPEIQDEKIHQGFIFGCDPDEDAILPDYVCETLDVATHPYRYGGGHFHVGSTEPSEIKLMNDLIQPMIQLLAIFVGNVCVGNSSYPEEDKLRTFHYGKPGRFRHQKWGVEYRTPSNAWTEKESTVELMIEGAKKAFYYLNHDEEGVKVLDKFLEPTISAITNANQELSLSIINEVL